MLEEVRGLEYEILGQLAKLLVPGTGPIRETAALEASILWEAEMQGRAAIICTPAVAQGAIVRP
jgi:hypothetical protein